MVEVEGIEYRLLVSTNTALATVLDVTRPAVAQMERQGRITRETEGWNVLAVVEDWRRSTSPYMQQHAADRPWLDRRCPLDESTVIDLVRRTRAVGGIVQARWDERGWLNAPEPIDRLRDGVPLEQHDITS